jgi:hypothetical protein
VIKVGLLRIGVDLVGEDGFDEVHGFLKSYVKPHVNALLFHIVIVLHRCLLKLIIVQLVFNLYSLIDIALGRRLF